MSVSAYAAGDSVSSVLGFALDSLALRQRTVADNIANLSVLADNMVSSFDVPKDGPDAEESGIPALYTYFGQFIDHDITFDPVSSLTKQQDPDGLIDFRTPSFDLDNLYGRGPNNQCFVR